MGSGIVCVYATGSVQALSEPELLGRASAAEYTLASDLVVVGSRQLEHFRTLGGCGMARTRTNLPSLFEASLRVSDYACGLCGIYYLLSLRAASNPRFNQDNHKEETTKPATIIVELRKEVVENVIPQSNYIYIYA